MIGCAHMNSPFSQPHLPLLLHKPPKNSLKYRFANFQGSHEGAVSLSQSPLNPVIKIFAFKYHPKVSAKKLALLFTL